MSWLTHEEAIRSAFEYRWRGTETKDPILLTDFNINNLRVIEVLPGSWNDAATWRSRERPMTDTEFAAINAHIRRSRGKMALGEEVMQEQGQPVTVRGYIKRSHDSWNATVDIDEVRRQIDADIPR